MHVEKGSKQVHYESGPDMTSLVDVMFVLLIFLMMVGKFGGEKHYLVSDLPISGQGAAGKVPDDWVPPTTLTVIVTSPTPDTFTAFVGKTPTHSEAELTSAIAGQLKALAVGDKKISDIQVYIKPARNVPYDQVVRVYTAAMEANAVKIGFQTSEG